MFRILMGGGTGDGKGRIENVKALPRQEAIQEIFDTYIRQSERRRIVVTGPSGYDAEVSEFEYLLRQCFLHHGVSIDSVVDISEGESYGAHYHVDMGPYINNHSNGKVEENIQDNKVKEKNLTNMFKDLSAEAQRIMVDDGIIRYANGRGPKIGRIFLHGGAENVSAIYHKLEMRVEMEKIDVKVGEPGVTTRGIDGLYWNLDVDDLVRLYSEGVLNNKNHSFREKR